MAALTFKSRVALHEATWLLYHKGTAHVPGGPGWPGEGDNPNFSLDIDQEIDYFLVKPWKLLNWLLIRFH